MPWVYPELRLCRDRAEEKQAYKHIGMSAWDIALPTVCAGAIIITWQQSAPIASLGMGLFSHRTLQVLDSAASFLAALSVGYALMWSFRARGRRRLRAYLLSRGHPLCVRCGYDLTGVPVRHDDRTVCPECGADLGPEAIAALERKAA